MYSRVIIKIGTNVISSNGQLEEERVQKIVQSIAELKKDTVEVVLVTSGAVSTGKSILGEPGKVETMPLRQVYAAVGQVGLMNLYSKLFSERGYTCAQVLVTKDDFRDREHYANMKNCFETLLKKGIVPIVNNNDTVTIRELGFGDNDEVAALVASQLNADCVLLLSSVRGVLDSSGDVISHITTETMPIAQAHVKKETSRAGTGGMASKFTQASRLMKQGIAVYIADGRQKGIIEDIISGKEVGTTFVPSKKVSSVKRRLSHADGYAKGILTINRGAEEMLRSGGSRSLLPVGVIKIEGAFQKGDTVEIRTETDKRIGSGVAQYGSDLAKDSIGQKGSKAIVHYDYLFIDS